MRLTLDIRPDLAELMAAEIAAGERAVTAAVREAGTGLKLGWRGQITGAGLGTRLANSIRSEVFPEGRRQPERGGGGLVEGAGDHRRARCRAADPGEERAVAGDPDAGGRQGARRAADHAGGLGAEDRAQAAVHLPAKWAELATRASGPRCRTAVSTDLPDGAAGEAAEAARPGAGCGAGARDGAWAPCCSVGGDSSPACSPRRPFGRAVQ